VKTNIPGDTLFFGQSAALPATATAGPDSDGDLFKQVTDFRKALSAVPYVYADVQHAIKNLETIYSRVLGTFTDLGGRQNSLDQLKSTLGDFNIGLQSIQETYEAVDYPQAITEYEREGTAQQVSLSILAKSNAQNLFDYLG
jgi:flagellin-like hook-associated protein FlgL